MKSSLCSNPSLNYSYLIKVPFFCEISIGLKLIKAGEENVSKAYDSKIWQKEFPTSANIGSLLSLFTNQLSQLSQINFRKNLPCSSCFIVSLFSYR